MDFWNEKRVRLANPKAKLYNFYEGWHAKGIKITHSSFEDGNIAIVRTGEETIGIPVESLEKVLDRASAIVCTNAQPFLELNIPIVEVPDLSKSVIYFAKFIRKVFKGKVIAVTGSSGKSTVTKMFYDVLEEYGVSSNLNQANTTWGICWNMSNFSLHVPYWIAQILGGTIAAFLILQMVTPPAYANMVNYESTGLIIGEFLFTFALCYVVLFTATSPETEGNSYYGFAIGSTVMVGIFAVGSAICYGAFNPAVAIALGTMQIADWSSILLTILANLLGGFAAAFVYKFVKSN